MKTKIDKLATGIATTLVLDERAKQEAYKAAGRFKFTAADREMSDMETLAVLTEEVGEAARALLEKSRLANDVHGKNLKGELVQVAAVALAWVEKLLKEEADELGGFPAPLKPDGDVDFDAVPDGFAVIGGRGGGSILVGNG